MHIFWVGSNFCGSNFCRREDLSAQSSLTWTTVGDRLEIEAAGSWTAVDAAELQQTVEALVREPPPAQSTVVDISHINKLDTFGAWLLECLVRGAKQRGHDPRVIGVPDHYRGVLEKVQQTNRRELPVRGKGTGLLAGLEALGRTAASIAYDLLTLVRMLGALGEAFAHSLLHPRTFRLTSAVHHLDRVAWQAVPIILLITFLIGCIIAQQGIFHFRKFGADEYVVDLVGILVLREIGVLLVAIMVAGRSGSSYTAELGSMKMREEIDALRTMGLDPVKVLILPRVCALICALPILTFLGAMAALYGGGLVAWLYGGMSPAVFVARLREAISIDHFAVGMIKAPFMALVIGAVACDEGLKVRGSAESLGLQTTTSVVKAIFLVIVLDGVFAIFFASIGM
jgi:phospholipid/cholesterol/gamma-HCH transport system permease protein